MPLRRVAVLGGGPGGLYAARLLKLSQPRLEVTVYEQGAPETTFGFGVGLAGGTQRNLAAADPDTLRDVLDAGVPYDLEIHVDGRVARMRNAGVVGVARTDLLAVLQRHAEKAGVQLEFGGRRGVHELDADLVVAADGAGSTAREAGDFGARVEVGRGLHLWCGVDVALPHARFVPVRSAHGTFVAHAYPYTADRSTFLIETDEATWQRAGFAATTRATPPDETDTASLAALSELFAGQLHGRALLGNRTRWTRFRTVRCARWRDGRTVLLGDAAHTAHFSIGSGTKLALEDAIGLVEALGRHADRAGTDAALASYERQRRPAVERLQELARRSQLWWETFPRRLDQPVERLAVGYMTRSGNVPLPRLAATDPDLVTAALGHYTGTAAPPVPPDNLTSWVLDQPLQWPGHRFPGRLVDPDADAALHVGTDRRTAPQGALLLAPVWWEQRDPWDGAGDAVLDQARRARRDGADGFRVSGPPERPSLLGRFELAERLRLQTDGLVLVTGPETLTDDLATGLVSGRAHLVALDREERT